MKIEKHNIIKEYYLKLAQLNELDVVDDVPQEPEFGRDVDPVSSEPTSDLSEPTQPEVGRSVGVEEYSSLGAAIAKIAEKLSPQNKAQAEVQISRILDTGNGNMSYEKNTTADKAKKDIFEYTTSVVAALYKEVGPKQKENIRKFIFSAYNPYASGGSSSKFARVVAAKSIPYDIIGSKSVKALEYLDKIAMGVYEAVDYALENYNPNSGTFGFLMFMKSVSNTLDAVEKKDTKVALSSVSGDEPLGGGEEGDSDETMFTQMETPNDGYTQEQRENMQAVKSAISEFMREKLDNPKYKSWYELYQDIADQGLALDDIAEKQGIDVGGIRIKKMRLEQFLSKFVENGELAQFIRNNAGVKVKFPSNKFSFSAKGEKEATSEPMYIFQTGVKRNVETGKIEPDPHHPEHGEWVEMGKPKPMKGSTRDTLGDVAFGTGEEEEPGEEGTIAEMRKLTQDALMKEYRFLGFGNKVKKNDELISTLNEEEKNFKTYITNLESRVRKRVQSDGRNYRPEIIQNFENMTLGFVLRGIKGSVDETLRRVEAAYPPTAHETVGEVPAKSINESEPAK